MKRIFYIILLIAVLLLIGFGIYKESTSGTANNKNIGSSITNEEGKTDENIQTNLFNEVNSVNEANEINTNNEKTDIILGDNMFIAQINDIYLNYKDYIGKTIEIEGFPLAYDKYKFVGRYGPGCCVGDGYAYIEYEYDKNIELLSEKDWIKVTGEIEMGYDGRTDYVYIKAKSVEKLDVRGKDTVVN